MTKRETEIVFGRRHTDPDLSAPSGNVDTKAYSTAERLWSGTNGTIGLAPDPKGNADTETYSSTAGLWSGTNGTIGLAPDPKLNKTRRDNDSFKFPAVEVSHAPTHADPFAKHNVTYSTTGYTSSPEDWRANTTIGSNVTTPTFATKPPTDKIPPGVATAIKHDAGKTDWSLMPFEAVEEINKVLDFGARKYAAHNWKTGTGFRYTRVLSSLLRHTFAWARGEDLDPESGLSHLAHMGCNVVFLIYYNKHKSRYSNDDRATSWTA